MRCHSMSALLYPRSMVLLMRLCFDALCGKNLIRDITSRHRDFARDTCTSTFQEISLSLLNMWMRR